MMYFEYNHEGKRPLRIPMTEEAFLKAKDEPDRWFINFGSCVLEVTKLEYDKYYKEKERSRYIRRNAIGRLDEQTTLDMMDEAFTYEQSVFSVSGEKSVEDEVIDRETRAYVVQKVHEALQQLDKGDQHIVIEITIRHTRQTALSKEMGISQQTVSRRYHKVLAKLRVLLSELED